MLRADVPGIDTRLLEQRVRQELAASPADPAIPTPLIDRPAPADGPPSGDAPPASAGGVAPEFPQEAPPSQPISVPETPAPESRAPAAPAPGAPTSGAPAPEERPAGLIARTMAQLGALYRRHSRQHQMQQRFSEIWTWAGETADRVHELSRQIDALRVQLSALGDQHRELAGASREQLERLRENHRALEDQHARRLDRLDHTAVRLEGDLRFEHRRLARLLEAAGEGRGPAATTAGTGEAPPGPPREQGPDQGRPPALSAASELSGRFAEGFEERFRGSREEIKGRLGVHLARVRGQPMVTPSQPLLDIGCGRGEWLELLAEAAVPAYGIDANPLIVDACQRRGLAVARADAIEHLSRLPERALGAISAFHVIEHLPLEDMLRLIDEARRTLVPNGLLLLETPNPENLKVGALTFYQDPTHLKPLPPLLLEYLVASRGFHEVELIRLHPYPDSSLIKEDSDAARRLNDLLYGPQDIAVLARRA